MKIFQDGRWSAIVSLLYLGCSLLLAVVISLFDRHIMESVIVVLVIFLMICFGLFLLFQAIKGIRKRSPYWLLLYLSVVFSLISLASVAIPSFDQLGWLGF